MYGIYFSWGEVIFIGPGDGDFLILQGEEGDLLVVALCLMVRHIEDSKKVFYRSIEED